MTELYSTKNLSISTKSALITSKLTRLKRLTQILNLSKKVMVGQKKYSGVRQLSYNLSPISEEDIVHTLVRNRSRDTLCSLFPQRGREFYASFNFHQRSYSKEAKRVRATSKIKQSQHREVTKGCLNSLEIASPFSPSGTTDVF